MIDYLRNNGAPFTKVWIDMEGPASTYWTSNTATNEQFLINLIGGLKSKVGVRRCQCVSSCSECLTHHQQPFIWKRTSMSRHLCSHALLLLGKLLKGCPHTVGLPLMRA
jgi:hypothetical protein